MSGAQRATAQPRGTAPEHWDTAVTATRWPWPCPPEAPTGCTDTGCFRPGPATSTSAGSCSTTSSGPAHHQLYGSQGGSQGLGAILGAGGDPAISTQEKAEPQGPGCSTRVYVCIYAHMCMSLCICVHIHICVCVCLCARVCIAWVCACIHTCMMCVHRCVWTCAHSPCTRGACWA